MIFKGLLIVFYSLCSATMTWLIVSKFVKGYIRKRIKANEEYFIEIPFVVSVSGFVEILLYVGSILVGKPEFIVVWTGVKTALRWDRKNKKENKSHEVTQRGTYHTFLIGTGLNIILAYIPDCLVEGAFIIL